MEQKNLFSLCIDEVFYIHNTGVVVTGRVENGCITQGAKLKISGDNVELRAGCLKLEKYLKDIREAHTGEYIAITLSGVSKTQIHRGMLIVED